MMETNAPLASGRRSTEAIIRSIRCAGSQATAGLDADANGDSARTRDATVGLRRTAADGWVDARQQAPMDG